MDFNEKNLAIRLSGRRIGNNIHFFTEVESTNDALFRLARDGAPHGTVVIAECQTKGKGRLNRQWQSPPGCNIYASIALRPAIEPVYAPQLTLMTSVAVADLLSTYCTGEVTLKWPNDVQIGGRKVCGILAEMSATARGGVDFIVVGIGINVNIRKRDFDESIRNMATSLAEEARHNISRLDLTVKLFDRFDALYTRLLDSGFGSIKNAWLSYCDMVGKQARVIFKNDIESGKVLGIDDFGALVISDEKGKIKRVIAGDASVVKG
ncbi:MAG: biotin--[acetyl-CoA-carboxylase] ligase [Syntrophales bacterium]|jgi:BirA family biotin operon repressor/biotin-[acetyl-CoA-carboxylase] ligase